MSESSLSKNVLPSAVVESPSDTDGPILLGADQSPPQPDGMHTIYYLSGQKCLEGHWQSGELHGPLTMWYESGQIKQEMSYEAGVLTGLYRLWHANGALAAEGRFASGKKTGTWKKWDPSGLLLANTTHD